MCATCGCESHGPELTLLKREGGHAHLHEHAHGHPHGHAHPHPHPRMIQLEHDVLHRNNHLAEHNREWLERRNVLALNLVSSPGSGKTTLLERTLRSLAGKVSAAVIEGDQSTLLDAERIRATGAPAVQVNTGTGCHLDAEMVGRALDALAIAERSLLFIENVGNLVCPALFDLGEQAKVVLLSVTEGDDKPLKYPHIFQRCALMIINKIDLLPYVQFDVARCVAHARQLNPGVEVLQLSATRGDWFEPWLEWLRARLPQ